MSSRITNSKDSRASISDYLDKLTPAKQKGKFICPVCGEGKLSINKNGVDYDCYGCHDTKGIWRAIAPNTQNGDRPHSNRKPRKSAKEKNREAQLNAAQVEAKVDDLAIMVVEQLQTAEQAALELSAWCEQWKHNAFNAGKLLKAKLKELSELSAEPKSTLEDARRRLEALVIEGVSESDIQIEISHLAEQTGKQTRELKDLYRAVWQECEKSTVDRADFDELAKATQDCYEISRLLPTLAPKIEQYAEAFNQPSVAFCVPLLSVSGSLLDPGTNLAIGGGTDYRLPPIFWGGLVADPGSIKTPIFNLALKPLHLLQGEAYSQHQADSQEHQQQEQDYLKAVRQQKDDGLEEPTPPRLKHYYCDNATVEKIQRIVTQQTAKGLSIAPDELSGFFNSFNQYRGGKGSDKDFWKSAAEGSAVKVDRTSEETRFTAKTSIGVTGTIQPEVLKAMMGEGDSDGFWSRFLWVRLPLRRLPAPDDGPNIDITSWLYLTYQRLEQIPGRAFTLSPEARKVWRDWHEWTEDKRLSTDIPVERVLYPKYRDRAGRVALIAHCLEYASQGSEPPETISKETLKAAISFTTYCLNQTRLLYADMGVSNELTGHLLRVWQWIEEKGLSEIKVSDLQGSRRIKIGPKDYAKAPYCREILGQLAALGYLTQDGSTFARIENPSIIESTIEKPFNSQEACTVSSTAEKTPKIEKLKGGSFSKKDNLPTNGNSPPGDIEPLSDRELATWEARS